jgi:hypothetical protein
MWWVGEEVHGKVQITETPAGEILKGLLKSGVMLGISSRGVGSVKSVGGKDMVQEDFELIAFDFVSSPSTPGAYLFKESLDISTAGLVPLGQDSGKILTVNKEEVVDKYKKLFNLYNESFWKNI